jgi:uncharacterized damage-inducible protein DinB
MRIITGLLAVALLAFSQTPPPELGKGWIPEFNHAAKQTLALAEATPAEKFTWRPAAGVRSVSEVYMHIAIGNYFLLGQAGFKPPAEVASVLKPDLEKSVTSKAEVIKWLKDSQDAVRANYSKADLQKKVKFFTGETTVDGVFLRILVHNHEHMGQSIAYARMIGVAPPWSQGGAQ